MNCKGELLHFDVPKIMGILNVTPDSFYDGGSYTAEEAIYKRIEQMLEEGADFIDVGGASTRPGAALLSSKEEWSRIEPALRILRDEYPKARVSVDTYNAVVAQKAVEEYGVCMINDVSAGAFDDAMFDAIARLNVPYAIMHMQGTPETMQKNPVYEDLVRDIFKYFAERINLLREKGVHDVIVDPGFGFSKTLEHNYNLLEKLDTFRIFECPVLVGLSRKSMIFKPLGISPEDALNGTIALNTIALLKGADMLRVHDVKPAKETILLTGTYQNINEKIVT